MSAAALIASPRTTWISLGVIVGLGIFGAGVVVGQMLERERPACGCRP